MTRILSVAAHTPDPRVLAQAADVVLRGGVIVYPTETLYGIGANAGNAEAVSRVAQVKRRKESKPILAIVDSREMLGRLAALIPDSAVPVMEKFWPGPVTIVFKAHKGLPVELTQGTGTVGVRIPSSNVCLELLRHCGCPLTSTSANRSGEPAHRSMEEIKEALYEGVDLFIDAGPLPDSKPSTIITVATEPPQLVREGAISFDALRHVLPTLVR